MVSDYLVAVGHACVCGCTESMPFHVRQLCHGHRFYRVRPPNRINSHILTYPSSLDQREKVNFIRNCSLALRVLAQESLIDNVHSTMFENWMDTHKVDIQRQAFWVDLWFQCRTLVK